MKIGENVDYYVLGVMRHIQHSIYRGSPSALNDLLNTNRRKLWKVLKSENIREGMIGLDVGAGDGSFANVSEMGNIISSEMFVPRTRYPVPFVQNSAEQLPFRNSSFDYVSFMYSLHHFADKMQALSEASRVLKNDGKIIIKEEFIRYRGQSRLLRLNEIVANESIYGSQQANEYVSNVSYFTRLELISVLNALNFEITTEQYSKPIRWYEPIYKTKKVLFVAKKLS